MATLDQQTDLLNRLQDEINLVLENTGRLFAAARVGNKAAPAAQAARLKRDLPGSISRFHDALDQLEDELDTARTVMRRDLAVARERSNAPEMTTEAANVEVEAPKAKVSPVITANAGADPDLAQVLDSPRDDNDVQMEDEATVTATQQQPAAVSSPPRANEGVRESTDEPVPDTANGAQDSPSAPETTEEKPEEETEPRVNNDKALHINTQDTKNHPTQPHEEAQPDPGDGNAEQGSPDDKPPDTGTFSNNADLDSLFNDPISAGGGSGGDALSFGLPTGNSTGAQEFDFGAFSTGLDQSNTTGADLSLTATTVDGGNDDLNNLLPGLSEYAGTQSMTGASTTDIDFDAMFAPVNNNTNFGQGAEGEQQQQDFAGEHRDSTFDDLMDFGDFGNGGNGDGGTGGNQDFEFSFD